MIIKSYTHEIASRQEFEMVKITDQVQKDVAASGITAGVVFVISMHTTTAIMINESLPCVEKDIELTLERLIPTDGDYVHTHMLPSLQRKCPGTFEVNALRKSLCASGNRWKNSGRKCPGYLFCGVRWTEDKKIYGSDHGRIT